MARTFGYQHSLPASASSCAISGFNLRGGVNSHRLFDLKGTVHTLRSVQHWMYKMFQLEHISHMFQSEH